MSGRVSELVSLGRLLRIFAMPFPTHKLTAVLLVATALTVTPTITAPILGLDGDAAYANPGKGKGGGKGGSKGNSSKGKSKSSTYAYADDDDYRKKDRHTRPLHPSEKGRWNASNANQRALDAHIRNQNFNGTIGALSQYQLAAKAANGDELNSYERAALEEFVDTSTPEVSDQRISRFLNQNSGDTGYVFDVNNGVVTCESGCPSDPDELEALERRAQNAADQYVEETEDQIEQRRLNAFLLESERRIIEDSNKDLTRERNQDLLDELADDLDVVRQEFGDGFRDAGDQIKEDFGEVSESFSRASKEIGKTFRGLFKSGN